MNLPNKLTLLRIILVPFFIIAMLVNFPFHYLVAGCIFGVGLLGSFGAIPVIIVLFREFAVSGIRLVAASSGKVVAANIWGKIKTVSQMVGISVIFAMQVVLEVLNAMKVSTGFITEVFYYIGNGLIWISTVFTLISGIIYLKDNISFLKDN